MEDLEEKKENIELCSCGENEALEEHLCPYDAEINDDFETLCTCCADCIHECAMSI